MVEEVKITKIDVDNESLLKEILQYNIFAKEHELMQNYSNAGGDHVTVLDTKEWPELSKFNKAICDYCSQNIPSSAGFYYWYNINYPNCYNSIHTHGRGNHGNVMLRCLIYYVSVPKDSGDLVFLIDNKQQHHEPKASELIDFDKTLMPGVEPNLSEDIRVSIAINVYNVYDGEDSAWKMIENQ